MLRQIQRSSGPDTLLLPAIDILHRLGEGMGSAQLHFHEDQIFFVPNDQIDLSKATAEPGRLKDVMLFAKMIPCQSFAPGTDDIISPHRIS